MAEGNNSEKSPLESLGQRLNKRGSTFKARRDVKLRERSGDIQRDWEHEHTQSRALKKTPRTRGYKLPLIFLGGAFIFFIIAVIIAVSVLSGGNNVISSDNIGVTVAGPSVIDGGETLSLDIVIANNNPATLKTADLLVEFTSGTRSPVDTSVELTRIREGLGDIKQGEVIKKSIDAVVFGESNDRQDVVVTLEYRVEGSNAIFVKEKAFTYEIGDTPLSVLVDMPSEVNTNQDFEIMLNVVSNSTETLENVVLKLEYPFGFAFLNAAPEASNTKGTVWELGSVEPGSRIPLRIRGSLTGQHEEERTFRFIAGVGDSDVETEFLTASKTVAIKKPFIDIQVALNGSPAETIVAGSAEPVRIDVSWRNTLSVPIENMRIEMVLDGNVLDENSVKVDRGFYRSQDNRIIWTSETLPELALVEPLDSGTLSATFAPFDLGTQVGVAEPAITLETSLIGTRIGDDQATARIDATLPLRTVRVASDFLLTSRAVYFVGPFSNTGPMPPEAEEETTYTIIWSVTNSANHVRNARVEAMLPSYIRWIGTTAPSSETVSYNPIGGTVTWDIGSVLPGVGYSEDPREVAFQIGLSPSISQIGEVPVLVGEATLEGEDRFTQTTLTDVSRVLDTRLRTDPQFSDEDSAVDE